MREASEAAAWLGKPVRQAALFRVMAAIVGKSAARQMPSTTDSGVRLRFTGGRVLLAEDNAINQKVALRALSTLGIEAELVVNGEEALRLAKSGAFDLVLMDCQMPVMDGYEATIAIREWELSSRGKRLPIVAMTANALAADRARCLGVGMDDHIAKPFKREELSAMLAKWLPQIRQAAALKAASSGD
jgi:CheY-like chemotaxis protein